MTAPRLRQVPDLASFLADTGHARAIRGFAQAVQQRAPRKRGKGVPAGLRQGVVTAVAAAPTVGPMLDVRMDGDSGNGTVVPRVLSTCPVLPHVGDMVWCLQAGELLIAVACNRFLQEDTTTYTMSAVAAVTVAVTYPAPFSAKPAVLATAANVASVRVNTFISAIATSGGLWTGMTIRVQQNENIAVSTNGDLYWAATGLA